MVFGRHRVRGRGGHNPKWFERVLVVYGIVIMAAALFALWNMLRYL